MENPRFRHRVEHTRNKHSRAVCRGNTIVIRLARNLSKTEAEEHIRYLLRRMTHILLREREKKTVDPFRHLLDGGQTLTVTLATGRKVTFTLAPGSRTRARRVEGGWKVWVSPHVRRRALHRYLWALLAAQELPRICALVARINNSRLCVPVSRVKLRFATTQWGSCSPKGVIMLNAVLLFLPPKALTYVIVHELAHRRRADHSTVYWNIVEEAMPTYKAAYDLLHEYRLPHE